MKNIRLMKSYLIQVVLIMAALTTAIGCSTDSTEPQNAANSTIAEPQVIVRELTTTGFTLRWNAVEGAGSYTYSINAGEEQSTRACQISFADLERQTEYVVALKACPSNTKLNKESNYTYIHVTTDFIGTLQAPTVTLGCAYASRTVISWSPVANAASYEYTFNGKSTITEQCQVQFSMLETSTNYTFSVKAISEDATRYNDSEATSLIFDTEEQDMASIIIAPLNVTSDYVHLDVYATSDVTYFYDVVPASLFVKNSEAAIIADYSQAILTAAKEMEVSLPIAMASLLKAGNSTIKIGGLTQSLSYMAFAFGMNGKGEVTTGLYKAPFKTPADGYTNGPNFGSAAWFSQLFFISNDMIIAGYDSTNSTFLTWKGKDVTSVRYQVLNTNVYNQLFTTTESVRSFLKGPNARVVSDPELSMINGSTGMQSIYIATPAVTYTVASLVGSSSGAEELLINSVTTRTNNKPKVWFSVALDTAPPQYGPPSSTLVAALVGVNIKSGSYAIFAQSSLAGIPTSQYPDVVEQYGRELTPERLASVNAGGLGLIVDELTPSTPYVLIASATNITGDKVTYWDVMSTTAAATTASVKCESSKALTPITTVSTVPNPESFIFPVKVVNVGAAPKQDLWTIIHNMQILK